jgi:NADPH:quinone reductase-like Zn-dependent oxidoreductase
MRAVVINGYRGPEHVAVADVPRPRVSRPSDVVVAVKAAALNHLDLFVTGGLPGVTHEFPHVLGSDGAGIVEAVGTAVAGIKPGDRVVLNPGVSCGSCDACLDGEQSLCPTFGVLGEHYPGTCAEAVVVDAANVWPLPSGVAWSDAAAYPLSTLTAWRMLATRAGVRPGELVLIWGIGGGVALAALGVAKLLGARVIVTSSSDEKLARARSLGADETINHRQADVAKEVRRISGKRGADVVVDSVGEATWETSTRALARGGRLVTCGGTTGPMVTTDVRRLFWHHWTIMGSTMGNHREFGQILTLLVRGQLKPVVDRVMPLADGPAAFMRLARAEQFGKIVLEVDAS